jgi:hypothetical protein
MTEQHQIKTVEILLEAPLSTLTGLRQTKLEIHEPLSVSELLLQLAATLAPELRPRLVRQDGTPASGLLIFLNNQPTAAGNAGQVLIRGGDSLLLCPPISGG